MVNNDKKEIKIGLKAEPSTELKTEAKIALPPPKYYYDVKVECMLPAVLTYRVLAEDAQQAAEMIKNMHPVSIKHKLIGRKDSMLRVYDSGSSMIKFIKRLFGG